MFLYHYKVMGHNVLYLVVIILVAITAFCFLRSSRNSYKYLGNVYNPLEGGNRGELNEECLQHPGYRMCQLTDGTPGVCALSGMCVADMEIDLRKYRQEIPLPRCTKPIFKEGCQRFCNCRKLQGSCDAGCVDECTSWFSPL